MLRQLALFTFALAPSLGLAHIPDSNADLNGDVITNSLDFSILASCFGQDPASDASCTIADVDRDGDIDTNDFVFVAARFGQAYPWKLYPLSDFAAGDQPQSVALGDLNGDRLPDLAVANAGSGDVSVLLSNGDGSFQTQQRFAAGDQPQSVTLGDLNGDRVLDMAIANQSSNDVSVLLGNGDGSFQDQQRFDAGDAPQSVTLGDLNGDHVLDMAIANQNSNDVSVLLGNGDGSFQDQQRFAVGDVPFSVALGDVNGDSVLDMAVANSESFDVSVLLGNGDGSFQAVQRVDAGGYAPVSVALGDVNGDSVLDMAVANTGDYTIFGGPSGYVSVLLGNDDGSFQALQRVAAGRFPVLVTFGDVNGDNLLDLAVANAGDISDSFVSAPGGNVSVLLGSGDGSFQAPQHFAAGLGPVSVALGDVNGDSVLDMAVANDGDSEASGEVSVLLGNGDGSFQTQQRVAAGYQPFSVALGDVNGDRLLDLAVANVGSEDVSVLLGNGDGSFQPQQRFAAGDFPRSVALGDLSGDSILDLVVANGRNDVSVLLGNGDGSFQDPQRFDAGGGPNSMALGDVDGDGLLDLAVTNFLSNDVSVLLGNGDGSFQPRQRFATGDSPSSVTLGDVNGDRLPDLAVANRRSGDVSVLIGNGDGSFQSQQRFPAGDQPRSVALADLNGDSVLDLAFANSGSYVGSGDVAVLLGNGDGSFQVPQLFAAGGFSSLSSVVLGDVNGDGVLDIAVANGSSNDVSVLIGNRGRR